MLLTELPSQAMGPQPPVDFDKVERFVSAHRIATLACTKRDNTPAMVPICEEIEV